MESSELLLEYLKEQYAQARQHETRQTAATSFLTGVAAVILGFTFKDGALKPSNWWIGVLIVAVGAASLWINKAHYDGNRFHTKLAGKTRRALENVCTNWIEKKPTQLRQEALKESGLDGPDVSIGKKTYCALQIIPVSVVLTGLAVIILTKFN